MSRWRRAAADTGVACGKWSAESIPTTPDVHLHVKLIAEAGRILTWALTTPDTPISTTPPEMLLAAESMRAEQDPVGEWLAASF